MCISELKKDFEEALECINFKGYDPNSVMFRRALLIGQMFTSVKCLENADDVKEELDGAETYFNEFEKTGDTVYKDMASDELRHAGILIKKHLVVAADEKVRCKLNKQEQERQEMIKIVSAPPKPTV